MRRDSPARARDARALGVDRCATSIDAMRCRIGFDRCDAPSLIARDGGVDAVSSRRDARAGWVRRARDGWRISRRARRGGRSRARERGERRTRAVSHEVRRGFFLNACVARGALRGLND